MSQLDTAGVAVVLERHVALALAAAVPPERTKRHLTDRNKTVRNTGQPTISRNSSALVFARQTLNRPAQSNRIGIIKGRRFRQIRRNKTRDPVSVRRGGGHNVFDIHFFRKGEAGN